MEKSIENKDYAKRLKSEYNSIEKKLNTFDEKIKRCI